MANPRVRKDPGAPPVGKQEESENFLQARLRNVGDAFGAADDFYIGGIRDNVLRIPATGDVPDGEFLSGFRNNLGTIFSARAGAEGVNPDYQYNNNNFGDKAGIFANRAFHAGGLTAAGLGLAELTGAVVNQFGGPADQQPQSQLYM